MAFAFGAGSPVYEMFHRFIPGVAMFRMPSRMLFFASFAVAMLAGVGVDVLEEYSKQIRQGKRLMPRVLAGLALVTTCLMLASLSCNTSANLQPVFSGQTLSTPILSPETWSVPGTWRTWAWLTAGLSLICVTTLSRKKTKPFLSGVMALAVLESSLHAHQVLRTAPPESLRSGEKLSQILGPNEGLSRTLVQQEVIGDQEAAEQTIFKVQGYEPVCLLPYAAAIRSVLPETSDFSEGLFGFAPIKLNDFSKPGIDMLGVRWAITTSDEQAVPAGWKLLSSGSQQSLLTLRGSKSETIHYQLYENTTVLPRAMVVGKARLLKAGEDGTAALGTYNSYEEVLLLKDVLPEGPRAETQAARIELYTANEVIINVDASAPGYLVLSDSWHPGWRASVDEIPTEILRANVAFRAVPVPTGNHTVRFQFWPPGLSAGATISLLTLLAMVCMAIRPAARNRIVDAVPELMSAPALSPE